MIWLSKPVNQREGRILRKLNEQREKDSGSRIQNPEYYNSFTSPRRPESGVVDGVGVSVISGVPVGVGDGVGYLII